MIKLKELLKESFYVALVSSPRRGNFDKPIAGNPKLMSKGRGAGLPVQSVEKILKSEIGRNLSREAAENAKVVATYDEKGVHHGRINMGPRRFVSAIAAEVDIEERKLPKGTSGVVITNIQKDSPLNYLEVNNIIVEAQKKKINTVGDLKNIIDKTLRSSEKTLLIAIYNNKNQRRYIGVKLN